MKKTLITLVVFLTGFLCIAQDKVSTRNGKVSFYSKATLSSIEAHNSTAVSALDKSTGNIEFAVLMKGFEFEKPLMQEHFNEDYIESDKYPKSFFKGVVLNIGQVNFSKDGNYSSSVSGNLTIHGVTKPVVVEGQFVVANGVLQASSEFTIVLKEYNIKIPSILDGDISNTIKIRATFKYDLK